MSTQNGAALGKRFELTDETRTTLSGATVYRIRALVDIPRWGVKAGDLGGFIEGETLANGNAWVSGDAWVELRDQILVVGPIGSEGVTATLYRTKGDGHQLVVGCWTGALETLMAEVKRRRKDWGADEATQDRWTAQYKALRALGRATVSAWEPAEVAR